MKIWDSWDLTTILGFAWWSEYVDDRTSYTLLAFDATIQSKHNFYECSELINEESKKILYYRESECEVETINPSGSILFFSEFPETPNGSVLLHDKLMLVVLKCRIGKHRNIWSKKNPNYRIVR